MTTFNDDVSMRKQPYAGNNVAWHTISQSKAFSRFPEQHLCDHEAYIIE